ncbi:elongation factor P maturation arginine rhamnosyltransferase EarP [Inhella gelatinilytica]|uniref:Protein-arginine rhamnosyltransferase n=1 Tax=Inhella gelatinilytica TaxID=2795030 RepID=A0A931IZD1_9BURK|nr:elongation factor P maturation arginine rhamnosyltransferase EarP [Inhella gelatinilytica]MBH9553363.1 elongation factor P maturation arginine rhamnosyltransferase EarP [Inhella gelatinilytica]
MASKRWDIFCRVIDNHGDVGVCWRLCRDLVRRGQWARLWLDDARALSWMAPHCPSGLEVHPWPDSDWFPSGGPGEVVIEAFGCELPECVKRQLPGASTHWFNLEYLSAEPYVERSHGLPSPVGFGPAQGMTKIFWYPGFTTKTGGLLRELDLLEQQRRHQNAAFWRRLGVPLTPSQPLISLFCYPHAPVDWLIGQLQISTAGAPVTVLVCGNTVAPTQVPSHVTVRRLPWLSQEDYDALLWSCDLNVVRGEDSLVRAIWANKPFLWHIYRQDDGAHDAKLEAFMRLWPGGAVTEAWRTLWRGWNGLIPLDTLGPVALSPWATPWHRVLREQLLGQKDLCTQLMEAVQG